MLHHRTIDKLPSRDVVYAVPDGDVSGLELMIYPSGKKSWTLRYRFRRAQRRLKLGTYPSMTLGKARDVAKKSLAIVNDPHHPADPAEAKQERRDAMTMHTLCEKYMTEWAKPRKRSWAEDQRRITKHVLPVWKHRAASEITRGDVKQLLQSIEAPVEANLTHALISKIFSFAIDEEIVTTHPCARMKKLHKAHARDRVLTHDEVRTFWSVCDTLDAPMAAFYKLRLLTAQRGGEVRSLRWADVDLVGGMWTIPATIAKNGLAHRVPLNATALGILKALRADVDARLQAAKKSVTEPTYVLENARGKRQQAAAAATFGITDFHAHDLRRTAASLMASAGTPRLVISKILNHVESSITAVYDRHGYDAEKRMALDAWDRQLTNIIEKRDSTVVPFARRG